MRTRLAVAFALVLVAGAARAEDLPPPPAKPLVLVPRWPSDRRPLEITAGVTLYSQIPLVLGTLGLSIASGLQGQTDNGYCCSNRFNLLRWQLALGAHGAGMFSLATLSTGIGLMVVTSRPYLSLAPAREQRTLGIVLVIVGVLAQAASLALDAKSWSPTSDSPDMSLMGPGIVLAIAGPIVTGAGIAYWVRGAEDVRHAERTQVSASPAGLIVRF
jgi:hypothetical protein